MENFKLNNWRIIKDDISELADNCSEKFLTEDLFQIQQNDYTIDAGWYGCKNGFITYLIYKYDWENPLIRIESNSISNCLNAINLIKKYVLQITK